LHSRIKKFKLSRLRLLLERMKREQATAEAPTSRTVLNYCTRLLRAISVAIWHLPLLLHYYAFKDGIQLEYVTAHDGTNSRLW